MKTVSLEALYSLSPKAIWQRLKQEHLSFWCACGYLFFEYVRPQSIYLWLDFFPWASFFVVSALLLSYFDKANKPKLNILDKLLLLYAVLVLLSSIFAVWPSLAFDNISIFLNWVIIYFAITRVVVTRERFFIFFFLYILANYKMAQHGFLSWAARGFSFTEWGVVGAPGWFANSGEFGIQLTIFLPLSVAFILGLRQHWGKFAKWLFYLMPVTAAGSILASSSRGAVLGLVALGLWAIRSNKYFVRSLLMFCLAASLAWVIIPTEFKERFEVAGDDSDRTSVHRLDRWKSGWDAMLDRPILGVGHKNWTIYYKKYYSDGSRQSLMIHNIFMESGTEHGFLGLLTLLWILFAMFRINQKTRNIAEENGMKFEHYISYGMSTAVVGMSISACFITVLYYPYVWIHAAFVTALYNSVAVKPANVSV